MKIDRALQRRILEGLATDYTKQFASARKAEDFSDDMDALVFNLRYLAELQLIEGGLFETHDGSGAYKVTISKARITARGIDFLQDDGGLSAILGTVTVKLHADTIRDLIEARIMMLSIPEAEKHDFIFQLRSLSEAALRNVATRVLERGLEALFSMGADACAALRTMLFP